MLLPNGAIHLFGKANRILLLKKKRGSFPAGQLYLGSAKGRSLKYWRIVIHVDMQWRAEGGIFILSFPVITVIKQVVGININFSSDI